MSRILMLFCGAGGGSRGYANAGWTPVGVDIVAQPNYPYPFIQADALDILRRLLAGEVVGASDGNVYSLDDFDAIHASPPCPRWSVISKSWNGNPDEHPALIEPTRALLEQAGLPYVIENVVGSPLRDPIKLCGSMFDRAVERHRLFECSFPVPQPHCNHERQRELWPEGFPALRSDRVGKRARVVSCTGSGGGAAKDLDLWRWAMGVPWMKTKREVSNTVPPEFCEYIGKHIPRTVKEAAA